jgi:hypothetical protein
VAAAKDELTGDAIREFDEGKGTRGNMFNTKHGKG